jgi:hypothetical protein
VIMLGDKRDRVGRRTKGDVPIAVELRRADVARNECYAALVTWATGLIAMRSW